MVFVLHKKKNDAFVNEEVRIISGQIRQAIIQNLPTQLGTITENDALGKFLGKEHSGRVRSMGFGPTPSSVFGMSIRGYGSASSSSCGASSNNSELVEQIKILHLELEAERGRRNALEIVLASAFQEMFERVPQNLADVFSNPQAAQDDRSGDQISVPRHSSASHNPKTA